MENMTFSSEIKHEITLRKINKKMAINFLNGFLFITIPQNNNYIYTINNKEVLKFVQDILVFLNIDYLMIKKNQICFQVSKELQSIEYKKESDFFAAIFLLSGSISDVNSTLYHLEIKFQDIKKAVEIQSFLRKYSLNFKYIVRKKSHVLYIKKVEEICDFLKAIGASNSYLKFEETKIDRDFKNSVNRLTNFDFYNQQKIADSNIKFLKQYDFIIKENLQEEFSADQLEFFKIKKENLDYSLSDISMLMKSTEKPKSRSTLNYYLNKLNKVYESKKKI